MTNKIVLRSTEEFLADFKPTYSPIMPLFDNTTEYAVEAGKVDFKRAEAMGDLHGREIGPKDTEMHQIASREGTKTFKKYYFGAQYIQSQLQDRRGYEDVVAQVLDEHNKQNDALLLTGGGTSAGTVKNNGLFWSADPNYILKDSAEMAFANGNNLAALYAKVMSIVQEANDVDGRKLVMFYGANTISRYNGLFASTDTPFAKVIGDALPPGSSQALMPSAVTPASSHGFMVINLDQIHVHYSCLPKIFGQGINDEKLYAWTNFLMGSSMVDVKAYGGIIRQPLTFASS